MFLQEHLPQYEEAYDRVIRTGAMLQDMNMNEDIVVLRDKQQNIEARLAYAAELSDQVDSHLNVYKEQHLTLTQKLEEEYKWLNDLRDKLQDSDDTSTSDEEMVDKLSTIKV